MNGRAAGGVTPSLLRNDVNIGVWHCTGEVLNVNHLRPGEGEGVVEARILGVADPLGRVKLDDNLVAGLGEVHVIEAKPAFEATVHGGQHGGPI